MNDDKITLTLTLSQLQMLDTLLSDKVGELQAANRPWHPPVGPVAQANLRNMEYLLECIAEAVIPAEEAAYLADEGK